MTISPGVAVFIVKIGNNELWEQRLQLTYTEINILTPGLHSLWENEHVRRNGETRDSVINLGLHQPILNVPAYNAKVHGLSLDSVDEMYDTKQIISYI